MSLVFNLLSRAAFTWRKDTARGQLLRLPLRALPKAGTVRILSGPARGLKWIFGAGVADFWVGTYETEKAKLFVQYATLGSTIYDIGANVGFYTLLASRAVGPTGRVVSFEPVPRNLKFLRHHLDLNRIRNVELLDIAVSDSEGMMELVVDTDPKKARIAAAKGDITVRTTTLDRLIERLPSPDLIEMDIEGAEYLALRGAEQLLRKTNPVIFLSTHGRDIHRLCCEMLINLGYKLRAIGPHSVDDTDELICTKSS